MAAVETSFHYRKLSRNYGLLQLCERCESGCYLASKLQKERISAWKLGSQRQKGEIIQIGFFSVYAFFDAPKSYTLNMIQFHLIN